MLRLIGILTGALLAIAFLIVALGIPERVPPDVDPALTEIAAAVPESAPLPEAEPRSTPQPPAEAAPTAPVPEPDPLVHDQPESAPSPDSGPEALPAAADPAPAPVPAENWYAFWSPFRSELAANGFISRLQQTTGIDYRVVRLKPGVYEVAFAYTDDADIEDKLDRIAAATGLDMAGS